MNKQNSSFIMSIVAIIVGGLALTLVLTGCSAPVEKVEVVSPPPVEVSEPEAAEEGPEPSTFSPVEQAVIDTFRIAVPNDAASDAEVMAEVYDMADLFRAHLDSGENAEAFLMQMATEDAANLIRNQALLTGAIAVQPDLGTHDNY